MAPTIIACAGPPDGGKGQARDMQVRWALETALARREDGR